MDYLGHGWGMGFAMWFPLILFGFIIYYFFKENNKSKTASAQDMLDKRYANGEIDKEEYEERSRTLRKNNL